MGSVCVGWSSFRAGPNICVKLTAAPVGALEVACGASTAYTWPLGGSVVMARWTEGQHDARGENPLEGEGMKIHLVDGTYELFRSYFGAPPKKAPDGT